jgi:glutaryl-CoA dehydrogenase (non-decarboxylating)
MWISLATKAHNALVVARTHQAGDPHEELSAFIVELDRDGIKTGDIHGKLGVRAGSTGWISMTDVRVPAENRLGEEGEGFKIAMSCLDNGRYTVAAGATGLIRASLDASVKYCHDRKAFGREIGKFQLVQQKIAHMARDYEMARLLDLTAGWLKNQGVRNTKETSLAKWFATDASVQASYEAIQIHGAYGFSDEYDVERYWRNSRGGTIYEGTSEIHQLMQAGYALDYRKDGELRCELAAYEEEAWNECEGESAIWRVGESASLRVCESANRRICESASQRIGESANRRICESPYPFTCHPERQRRIPEAMVYRTGTRQPGPLGSFPRAGA